MDGQLADHTGGDELSSSSDRSPNQVNQPRPRSHHRRPTTWGTAPGRLYAASRRLRAYPRYLEESDLAYTERSGDGPPQRLL